jgi:hypothetical protein
MGKDKEFEQFVAFMAPLMNVAAMGMRAGMKPRETVNYW